MSELPMSDSPLRNARPSLVLPLLLGPLLMGASGCGGGVTSYSGTKMADYFNAESIVRSTYANEDQATVPDNLLLTQPVPSENVDGRIVFTLEQRMEDDNDTLLGGVKWSAPSGEDVWIHGWEDAAGTWTDFDPPIGVTDPSGNMHVGDFVVTETGGVTYTSTFVGQDDCPVLWTQDTWEDCVHMNIDDGGGATSSADPASRPIFVGDYWLVTRFFVAWMLTSGWDEKWVLSDYDEPSDEQG